jgi:outer membrane protein OmpU
MSAVTDATLTVATFLGLLAGGIASAQGIALYGEARLGLGYNIDNDGGVLVDGDGGPPDAARAISSVEFGATLTGETDSGVTFGAEINADEAEGGEGGSDGQTEGEVFVSGAWGTLSFGDTDGADEVWVGDVPGNYSLTGLGDINETRFVSNGGSFGEDNGANFAENPFARPTVRYDVDLDDFGVSLSTDRDLSDIGVGAGYAGEFAGGSWSVGAGYYRFDSFVITGDPEILNVEDVDGNPIGVEGGPLEEVVPDGEQWSVGLQAEYETFAFGMTYMKLSSDSEDDGKVEADELIVGASCSFDAFSVGAFWARVLSAEGPGDFVTLDGDDGYGLTAQYDLGGGATINGGIANSYSISATEVRSATIADFGIGMEF